MPIDFPASPSPGDIYPYNGKNFRRMNGYWSAVSQFAPVASGDYVEIPYDKNDMSRLNMVFANKVVPV